MVVVLLLLLRVICSTHSELCTTHLQPSSSRVLAGTWPGHHPFFPAVRTLALQRVQPRMSVFHRGMPETPTLQSQEVELKLWNLVGGMNLEVVSLTVARCFHMMTTTHALTLRRFPSYPPMSPARHHTFYTFWTFTFWTRRHS